MDDCSDEDYVYSDDDNYDYPEEGDDNNDTDNNESYMRNSQDYETLSNSKSAENAVANNIFMSPKQSTAKDNSGDSKLGRESSIASSPSLSSPRVNSDGQYILREYQDILPLLSELIGEVASLLNISLDAAEILLQTYKWSKERLMEKFFADCEGTLHAAGLDHYDADIMRRRINKEPYEGSDATATCPICYDSGPAAQMMSLGCNHYFCTDCYSGYLDSQVSDGPSCILSNCPQYQCTQRIVPSLYRALSSPEAFNKYRVYMTRNYIGMSRNMRYCPAPNCNKVAIGDGVQSVECSCGHIFCFRCSEEFHEPASCQQLSHWLAKCSDESETANWILANTKKCPLCMTRIEKNQGCNHMTCRVCRHEFCWICSGDWSDHGQNTGGYYKCNRFETNKGDSSKNVVDKARAELDRYIHYYQRYYGHNTAVKYAYSQLEKTEKLISEQKENNWIHAQYLHDAVELVIKCRKVLKYTYVLGYSLPDDLPEKRLFEHHQEMLEKNTERLHELTEKNFNDLDKTQIVNLSRVTQTFLDSLTRNIRSGVLESA